MIPVRGPHQSDALGGCLVCLCLRPALKVKFCSATRGMEIFVWNIIRHIVCFCVFSSRLIRQVRRPSSAAYNTEIKSSRLAGVAA